MQMTASDVDGVMLVTVKDRRIDAAVAVRFKDKMQELTLETADRVILDLSEVEFLDIVLHLLRKFFALTLVVDIAIKIGFTPIVRLQVVATERNA